MNIIFLKGYNNYLNRILKKHNSISAYMANSSSYVTYGNINFNPNDGITTELIVGNENQKENSNFLDWETNGVPDYAVCYTSDTNIVSRWFIIECVRTRYGQYKLKFKRDSIVDNYDVLLDAPMFVEKGVITDPTDKFLFNNENMTYNQIKNKEILLQDESKCAWVVGYIPKDFSATTAISTTQTEPIDTVITSQINYTGSADYTLENLSDFADYDFVNKNKHHLLTKSRVNYFKNVTIYQSSIMNPITVNNAQCILDWSSNIGEVTGYNIGNGVILSDFNESLRNYEVPEWYEDIISPTPYSDARVMGTNPIYNMLEEVGSSIPSTSRYNFNSYKNQVRTEFKNIFSSNSSVNVLSDVDEQRIRRYDGKVIKETSSGNFYMISVRTNDEVEGFRTSNGVLRPTANMSTTFKNFLKERWNNDTGNPFFTSYSSRNIYIEFVRLYTDIQVTIPKPANRYHLTNEPYDMFCIPYSDETAIYDGNIEVCSKTSKEAAINIATAITTQVGSAAIYDLQLLPYCPIRNILRADGNLDVSTFNKNYILTNNQTVVNSIFFCLNSEFSFDINKGLSIPYSTRYIRHTAENVDITYPTTDHAWIADVRVEGSEPYYYAIFDKFRYMNYLKEWRNLPGEMYNDDDPLNFALTEVGVNYLKQYYNSRWNPVYVSYAEIQSNGDIWIHFVSENSTPDLQVNMDVSYEYGETVYEITALDLKISNETEVYRLNSPNWNGVFDFSLAKMGGELTGFNVDCTYKPFQPYIHVNPKFTGLYGDDFDDARGLICGGDFSLPRLTNAWAEYVQNNKNYENIFNRGIENLDFNNNLSFVKDIVGAAGGTVTSAATGAAMGGVGGAIAGGVLSAIGGTLDVVTNQMSRAENKDYQVDNYNYTLGNIKALPTSLNKVNAFTKNNKIWPVLEIFKCSPEERNALSNVIAYNGMTIMRIDNLRNFIGSGFIKGKLIRLTGLIDDYHMATDIYDEIQKGVFI